MAKKKKEKKSKKLGFSPAAIDAMAAELAEDSLPTAELGPECFVDRELSWLQFNLRVLKEAGDRSVPLLERLKFLSIYYSNLDEFYMVRVGSLTHRNLIFPDYIDPKTGYNAAAQLRRVQSETRRQQSVAEEIYREVLADLKENGIDVLDFRHLSKVEETLTKKYFTAVRPLLSPRVVDVRHPLPFLGNRESYMAAMLSKGQDDYLGLVSLYRLPKYQVFEVDGRQKVAVVAEMVSHFAAQLFKKYDVRESCVVRLTRNADVYLDDDLRDLDEDYRESMEKMLKKRKRQQPVRLQISGKPSRSFSAALAKKLGVSEKSTFVSAIPFDLGFGSEVNRTPEMKFEERKSVRSVKLHKGEYFRYLEKHDILLSFPYQSITPFVELLYEAADDPDVVSIRITLYRLAASSKLAAALAYAADQGKDVLCLLELRARFDEQNNIDYSEVLEDAGCEVIYGLPEQKVHSKLCLITRRCGDEIRYVTQIGSGNYNEVTSEQYCDVSLITSDTRVGEDAAAVFDALAMGNVPEPTEKLWVAPRGFKSRLLEMLDREIEKGEEGFAALKVNSLNDMDVMAKLIECSRAGVRVELYIRGICCLRPGLEGCSENITVRSVVGRYLEHSRIFVFGRGAEQRIFMGSGDLLNRNTRRRVEVFVEAEREETREQLLEIMDAIRHDDEKGWIMQPDGSYERSGAAGTSSQNRLFYYFSRRTVAPDAELPEVAGEQEAPNAPTSAGEQPAPEEARRGVSAEYPTEEETPGAEPESGAPETVLEEAPLAEMQGGAPETAPAEDVPEEEPVPSVPAETDAEAAPEESKLEAAPEEPDGEETVPAWERDLLALEAEIAEWARESEDDDAGELPAEQTAFEAEPRRSAPEPAAPEPPAEPPAEPIPTWERDLRSLVAEINRWARMTEEDGDAVELPDEDDGTTVIDFPF